ncbi:MAG: hypothetical protein O9318_02710 [Hylemonella sp.]|uniref:hypothetical protein n=1 Tax=Hylemonella sp. TaxID=2066020 RepID=UPI0022C69CA7|nr:hypothetical protein [Hylemonella sp.]MCZ8251362.1 hypothetical protein [Hylemonella sp.]
MSDPSSLSKALVESLRSDEAIAVASQMAESAIDSQLAEGLLREVPVVGTVLAVAKAGATVRDALFVKKLFKFLSNFDGTNHSERDEMVRRLELDSEYGRNVGEHLTDLLEKLDTHRKPSMLGQVFLSYMRGQIDVRTLNRLNTAIERIPFYEIDAVRRVYESHQSDGRADENPETYKALENAGLMNAQSAWGGLTYQPSDLCKAFVDLQLDKAGS